jgi:hypothetical protein
MRFRGIPARRGTTLIEVLVSIFVMAIGLIALLALFPLGAFQMADAIKDDRVSLCVANATSMATANNLRHDARLVVPNPAFDKPSPQHVDLSVYPWVNGTSYPVYVDPIGYANYLPGPYRDWVAGANTPGQAGIPRRSATFATTTPTAPLQSCTFLDDITFDKNAMPAMPSGTVERSYGYSWAYLLRRPKNSVPSLVEMWVIVYQQRPLALKGLTVGGDETVYNAAVTGANTAMLAGTPALRPGSWILDCTAGPAVGGLSSPGNARFYRVVGITQNAGSTEVEVDSPILATPVRPSRFAVLDGVAEVVYKGTNWLP